MLELHRQPGLALESRKHLRVLGPRRRQHLDRDDLAQGVCTALYTPAMRPRPIRSRILYWSRKKVVDASLGEQAGLIIGDVTGRCQPVQKF